MVVYETIFCAMDRKFWLNLKKILIDNRYKLFSNQSVLFLQDELMYIVN